MEYNNRKCVSDKLSKYMPGFNVKDNEDYIEITEWVNEEGYDISFGDNRHISLHVGELEAINHLISCLDYEGREALQK